MSGGRKGCKARLKTHEMKVQMKVVLRMMIQCGNALSIRNSSNNLDHMNAMII